MTHPLELFRANEKTDRVPRRVIILFRSGTTFKAHDLQSGGCKFFGNDATQSTDTDNADIGNRLRRGHSLSTLV